MRSPTEVEQLYPRKGTYFSEYKPVTVTSGSKQWSHEKSRIPPFPPSHRSLSLSGNMATVWILRVCYCVYLPGRTINSIHLIVKLCETHGFLFISTLSLTLSCTQTHAEDSEGFRRTQENIRRFWSFREELGGIGRSWEEPGGIERSWEESGGIGRSWAKRKDRQRRNRSKTHFKSEPETLIRSD